MKGKTVRSSSLHSNRSAKDQQQRSSRQKVSPGNLHSVLDKIQFLQSQLETFLKSYPQESQLKYSFEKCRQLQTQLKQQVKLKSELAEMYKTIQLQNQSLLLQLNLLQSDKYQDSLRSISNSKLAAEVEQLKKQVKVYQERCLHLDQERKDSESPAQIRKQLNKANTQNLTLRVKINHYERMIIHPPDHSKAVSQSITLVAISFQLQRIHSILEECKKTIAFQSELENKVLAQAEVEKTRYQFQLLNYLESNAILRKQLQKSQQKIATLEKQKQQQSIKRYQSQQSKVKLNSSQYCLSSDVQLSKNLKQIEHKIREALSRQGNHVKTFNQVNNGSQKLTRQYHNHIILLELYIAEMDHAIIQLMRKNQHLAKNKNNFESTLQKYETLVTKYKTQIGAYAKFVHQPNHKTIKGSQTKKSLSQIIQYQSQTKLSMFLELLENIQQQAQLEIACVQQQMQTIKFQYKSTISEMTLQLQEMQNLKQMLTAYKQRDSKQIGNLDLQEQYKHHGKTNGSILNSPEIDKTVKHQTKNDLDPYGSIKQPGKAPPFRHEKHTAKKLKEKSIENLRGSHTNNSHSKLLTIESRQFKSLNQDSDANEDSQITHKILSLETQICKAIQQLTKLEKSKKVTEKALLQRETQNQLLQRLIDEQYSPQLQKYELLKQQHQQLIHQINKLKAEANDNSELQKQRQLLINRINELQTKEKRLEQALEKMHQEIFKTREEKECNLRAISTELKEKKDLIKDLENAGIKNSVDISQVQTKCSQYEGNLKQKEEELERLQAQVARLKEQNNTFLNRQSKVVQQNQYSKVVQQSSQLKQQIVQLKGQITQLRDQLQLYVCQVSQKNQIIAELSDKVNAMEEVSHPDPHYTSLSRISSFNSDNEMLPKDSRVQSLRETVRNMQSQLKKKEQKIAKQTLQLNQYSKLARKLDRYQKTLNQRAQEFTKLKVLHQNQCNQNLALKKKLELLSHSQEHNPHGLTTFGDTERKEFCAKLDSFKLELDKQLQQNKRLRENLQNVQKQDIKSLRKNNELQQENHKLNSKLLHLQGAQQTQRQQHDRLFKEMQESISIILFEREKQKEQGAGELKTKTDELQSQKLSAEEKENRLIKQLQDQINQLKIIIGKREIEIGNLYDAFIKITRKLSRQKEIDPQIKEIIRKVKEGHFADSSSNKNISSSSIKLSKGATNEQQKAKAMNRAKSQGLDSELSEFNTIIVGTPSKDSITSQVLRSQIEKFDFQNRQSHQLETQMVQPKKQNVQTPFAFRKYQQDSEDCPPKDQLQTLVSKKAFGFSIRKVAQVGKVKGEKVALLSQRSSSEKLQ